MGALMHAGMFALAVAALAVAGAPGCRNAEPAPARAGDSQPTRAARPAGREPGGPRAALGARGQARPRPVPGFIGVVIAPEQAILAASHAGEVVEVRVRIGDRVEPGDVLVRLDERPIREALALARAELSAARADRARAGAELAEARDRRERRNALQDAVAQEERNAAAYAVAKASAMRDRAHADVTHRRARLAQLERQLAEVAITAPRAGTVAMRHVDPGMVVQPGAPLVRLIAAGQHWVRFAVPAGQHTDIAPGDRITVTLEPSDTQAQLDGPGRPGAHDQPVPAVVRQIAPEIDPNSQMFLVEAALVPPARHAGHIHAGQAAWVQR